MPIDPSDPGQSATLFLEEAAKLLREAQENGDRFIWTASDVPEPEYGCVKRVLTLEIICRERPEEGCPVFTSEGGIIQ